jgi:SAM-dependent methyltransferase
MAPYGLALLDYVKSAKNVSLTVRRDDGYAQDLPVSFFFRDPVADFPIDRTALDHCRSPVLDVGAGAGIHSLVLQERELVVTALDVSPYAVDVLRRRGVRDVREGDVFDFTAGRYASILLLGHGIGVAGTLDGLDRLLVHMRSLLLEEGAVFCDSIDIREPLEPAHVAYQAANRKAGRYIGESRIRVEYGERVGRWTRWLHVDPVTLRERAARVGYSCAVLHEVPGGDYLARLRLD